MYAYFNNDQGGAAPADAGALVSLADLLRQAGATPNVG